MNMHAVSVVHKSCLKASVCYFCSGSQTVMCEVNSAYMNSNRKHFLETRLPSGVMRCEGVWFVLLSRMNWIAVIGWFWCKLSAFLVMNQTGLLPRVWRSWNDSAAPLSLSKFLIWTLSFLLSSESLVTASGLFVVMSFQELLCVTRCCLELAETLVFLLLQEPEPNLMTFYPIIVMTFHF